MSKKSRRRRRRQSPSPASDSEIEINDEAPRRKKKEKKIKEKHQYKSAQFIEDSDEEYGNIEAFLEKEKVQREKAARTAAEAGDGRIGTMKPTGTKKRRRKIGDDKSRKKKRNGISPPVSVEDKHVDQISSQDSDADIITSSVKIPDHASPPIPRPRPKPRPIGGKRTTTRSGSTSPDLDIDDEGSPAPKVVETTVLSRRRNRLVISDEEED